MDTHPAQLLVIDTVRSSFSLKTGSILRKTVTNMGPLNMAANRLRKSKKESNVVREAVIVFTLKYESLFDIINYLLKRKGQIIFQNSLHYKSDSIHLLLRNKEKSQK